MVDWLRIGSRIVVGQNTRSEWIQCTLEGSCLGNARSVIKFTVGPLFAAPHQPSHSNLVLWSSPLQPGPGPVSA